MMASECGPSGGLAKKRIIVIVLYCPSPEWIHNVKASNNYSVHLCP